MILHKAKSDLVLEDIPVPKAEKGQLLVKVMACGICRTDLHILDGELDKPNLPLIMGHQIVGKVEAVGKDVTAFKVGDRIGIPWLGHSCGNCYYCLCKEENLCESIEYTGYHFNGGFAEYCVCYADFALALPEGLSDVEIAPLLCAGLIGYRSYQKANPKQNLGLYGFGSAAHILTQLALYEKKQVYAFTRPGDIKGQEFAKGLGATWAGGSDEIPPEKLDAAIIFAPVGKLIPQSLKALRKGGRCICGGIHMSEIPAFSYDLLWGERAIESVANLTRKDGKEFIEVAEKAKIKTEITVYPLEKVNEALKDLREGRFKGSAVIKI